MRRHLCENNPDIGKITEMKLLIESATAKLAELQSIRDELKVELENEGYLDEDGEEVPQNDVKDADAE